MKLKLTGVKENREFRFTSFGGIYKLQNGELLVKHCNKWQPSLDNVDQIMTSEIEYISKTHSLTEVEKKILEGKLAEGFQWIARDKNGHLCTFPYKPTKIAMIWYCDVICSFKTPLLPPYNIFNTITWEDKEPTNIEELLNN